MRTISQITVIASLMLVFIACSHTIPPGSTAKSTAGGTNQSPPDNDLAEKERDLDAHYLLYTRNEQGQYTTHYLRSSGEGSMDHTASKGLLLAHNNRLWQLTAQTQETFLCDCDQWEETGLEGACPASTESTQIAIPFMTQLGKEATTTIVPNEQGPNTANGFLEYRFDMVVDAVFEQGMLVQIQEYSLQCGEDSPSWVSDRKYYNFKTGGFAPLFGEEERTQIRQKEQPQAFTQNAPMLANSTVAAADALTFTGVIPRLQDDFIWTFDYQFSFAVTQDSADGIHSGDTRSVTVNSARMPEKLFPLLPLPMELENIAAALEREHIIGWTTTSGATAALLVEATAQQTSTMSSQ